MNEGSEAREFSGRELWWWGRTVGDGLLGVPVVGGWLLGKPVVGLSGGAVFGSSLGSLHICDSRGTLAASVDVVVASIGTMWARSAGQATWTRGRGFGLWLPRRGVRLRFLGLWVTQWNCWWSRGAIRASSISAVVALCLAMFSYTHFPCATALECVSLTLQFLSRGNRCLLSSEAKHLIIVSVWMVATFSQRSSLSRSSSSMNKSFSCAWRRMRVKYSSLCQSQAPIWELLDKASVMGQGGPATALFSQYYLVLD